jgi:hypothetical protein
LQFQCLQCLAMTDLPPGTDPHSRTWCECCTIAGDDGKPHHHGKSVMSAAECEAANHPGALCLSPPGQPDKPDGCTACRPVVHFAVVGDPQAT